MSKPCLAVVLIHQLCPDESGTCCCKLCSATRAHECAPYTADAHGSAQRSADGAHGRMPAGQRAMPEMRTVPGRPRTSAPARPAPGRRNAAPPGAAFQRRHPAPALLRKAARRPASRSSTGDLRHRRKPRSAPALLGPRPWRYAERANLASSNQPPPRTARCALPAGPSGSCRGALS